MATRTNTFEPGRFCWVELATTDQAGAKGFYGNLFGWAPDDRPIGPDATYTMFKHGGRDAGAAYTLGPEQKGVPPNWGVYVAVASADDAAKRADKLGAKVLAPPFDVFDVGRMAVLQDPTGAVFSVWEARKQTGMGVIDEPGAFCWGELVTRDTKKADEFYKALFGWGTKTDPGGYTEWTLGSESIGGMLAVSPEWGDVPPHWGVYFQVTDCDATVSKVQELGGKALMGPQDITGVGRFAVVSDPQGASFSVIRPSGPGH